MSVSTQAFTLLVLSSQANEAERLIASLRNGGLPVRGVYTTNSDRIVELVERRACDLIVCCSYDPDVDLEDVLSRHRELDADVPLIVVADRRSDPQAMLAALRSGARDATDREDIEHLQLVVGRELADLQQRRLARSLGQRLQQCEQRTRELADPAGEAVAFVQDGLHVQANPAYLALFRFANMDDLQNTPFLDMIDPEQRKSVRDFLRERERSDRIQGGGEMPVSARRADSTLFRGTLIVDKSEVDAEPCLRLTIREAVNEPALPLSSQLPAAPQAGLPGFAELIAAMSQRLDPERRTEQPLTLFYIWVRAGASLIRDIGLSRGLASIGALADPLTRICGDLGTLARVNDDGFALLADGIDEPAAEALTKRIREEARLPKGHGKTSNEPDCDVGYVLVGARAAEASELLDEACRTCRAAVPGTSGAADQRKQTSLAARSKQTAEDRDGALAGLIEQALANDRFILVYQPIVSLMGDNQENYSVLLRMLDPDDNLREAQDFIPEAIRSGLIEQIDKWAIRHAIQAIGERRRAGHNLNFFINLAEDSFREPGIILWICDCLREFDVRGSWLTFVFQEEVVDGNLSSLNRLIESLKKIKCRVAVNRFGATDHPQMILQALSLDFVLLLPQYAQGLSEDKDKQQQLLALANLTREFNVKSVVTGVEDARTLTVLWTAGVDYVQGNFLQRPSPTLEVGS